MSQLFFGAVVVSAYRTHLVLLLLSRTCLLRLLLPLQLLLIPGSIARLSYLHVTCITTVWIAGCSQRKGRSGYSTIGALPFWWYSCLHVQR